MNMSTSRADLAMEALAARRASDLKSWRKRRDAMTEEERLARNARRMRHYRANRVRILAGLREQRAADPEPFRDAVRKAAAKARLERPEETRLKARSAERKWRKAHPDTATARKRLRSAEKRGAVVVERFHLVEIAERDGWRCHICGCQVSRETWSVDHLVPLSKGGDHTRINVALAHRICNSRRGAGRLPAQLLLL